jgi:hypothetical protein
VLPWPATSKAFPVAGTTSTGPRLRRDKQGERPSSHPDRRATHGATPRAKDRAARCGPFCFVSGSSSNSGAKRVATATKKGSRCWPLQGCRARAEQIDPNQIKFARRYTNKSLLKKSITAKAARAARLLFSIFCMFKDGPPNHFGISGLRVVFQHNGNNAANNILRHVNQILVPSVGAAGILDDLVTRKIVDAVKFAIELLCHCP